MTSCCGRDVGRALAQEWEAKAIEESRAELEALGMCARCAMDHPCMCDRDAAVAKMREYYEAHRRTLFRREPVGFRSWHTPYDVLMYRLFEIASEPWEKHRK